METCPCCGYKTITEGGNYELCSICFWEDESVQSADPWFEGGSNNLSLFEAQQNYKKFGAIEHRFVKSVRLPNAKDNKDRNWRELVEGDSHYCTTPMEIDKLWGESNAISYDYWKRNL